MFEVTVTAQVAFSRIDGGGTRRVRLADGTVLEFSRYPKRFEELPPEVAADPYLVKREVSASAEVATTPTDAPTGAAPAGDPDLQGDNKKGDRVQLVGPDGAPITDAYLAGLDYAGLVKLAKGLDINPFGKKKDDLREQLSALVAACHAAVGGASLADCLAAGGASLADCLTDGASSSTPPAPKD